MTLVTIPDGTPIAAWRRPLGGRRAGPTDRDPVTEVCPVCRERVDWSLCGVLVDLWKGHGADPDEDEQIDLGDLT